MRKRTTIIVTVAALLAVCSCQKEEQGGSLAIALTQGDVAEVVTKGKVSDYASLPDNSAFTLSVSGGKNFSWSGMFDEWDNGTKLKAGTYKASVSYGDPVQEGPSKPYFAGEAEFTIFGGETTEVNIPVSLGNCIVKIKCTDAFNSYFTSSAFAVTTGAGNVFPYNGEAIFIDAYKFTVSGTVTTQNGSSYSLVEKSWNVDAATCYTVKYDVSNAGSITVTVTFDDTVETVSLTEDLNA